MTTPGFPAPVPIRRRGLSPRLLATVLPFVVAILAIVALAAIGVEVLSDIRAYVNAESNWSRDQQQATRALRDYARSLNEEDFARYRSAIAGPLAGHVARLELERPSADDAAVTQVLASVQNDPRDIAGMIRLYRYARWLEFMQDPLRAWESADGHLVELDTLAQRMHEQERARQVDATNWQDDLARIDRIDAQLVPLEARFSQAMGAAARDTEWIVLGGLVVLSPLLIGAAWLVSRRAARRFEAIEHALAQSEERLKLAFAGTRGGIWDWDARSNTSYYSPRAYEMLGYKLADRQGPGPVMPELAHPDDRARWREAISPSAGNDPTFEVDVRLRRSDGSYGWYQIRGGRYYDLAGRLTRIAGATQDISAQKDFEAAILRQAQRQRLLYEFGQLALQSSDSEELLVRALQVASEGLACTLGRLLTPGVDARVLRLHASAAWQDAWRLRRTLDAADELHGRRLDHDAPLVQVDDFLQADAPRPSAMLEAHRVRSALEAVVHGHQGWHAVLGAYATEPGHFDAEAANFLRSVAMTLASALDRRRVEERLLYLAQFDPLTGLPNRSMFLERLAQAIARAERDGSGVCVLFVDLDRFKIVNDTLGHGAGDELLLFVAQRLRACVRAADAVGRLGGDEFAVALFDQDDPKRGGRVATKIIDALSQAFEIAGRTVYISASVGISAFPEDGRVPDDLLRNADTAMYRAKSTGRATHCYFDADMNRRAVARLALESDLRRALHNGEFLLHYQPRVELEGGTINGFEALLRWQHPQRGLVAPGEFIPLLEETGLIVEVGDWVLRTACEQIAQWRAQRLPPLPVAVNLSPRQFAHKGLEASIAVHLAVSRVPPRLLELELTESMLMPDPQEAIRILQSIKDLGVRLCVDDFGTGYSSLSYLRRFPLDSLKIDRTFLRDVALNANDAIIARSIIRLAHGLKLGVVAEGVESAAQLAFLRESGCDAMQGFVFAPPMPPGDCAQALRSGRQLVLPPRAALRGVEPHAGAFQGG